MLSKYVGKNEIIKKYVKTCIYGEICKQYEKSNIVHFIKNLLK